VSGGKNSGLIGDGYPQGFRELFTVSYFDNWDLLSQVHVIVIDYFFASENKHYGNQSPNLIG